MHAELMDVWIQNSIQTFLEMNFEYYGMDVSKIIFQQDNDPILLRNGLRTMGVEVLDWPTKSPDLNPIEHLWQHLKRQLAKYENDPSIYELWERVETEWNSIPPQICLDVLMQF